MELKCWQEHQQISDFGIRISFLFIFFLVFCLQEPK